MKTSNYIGKVTAKYMLLTLLIVSGLSFVVMLVNSSYNFQLVFNTTIGSYWQHFIVRIISVYLISLYLGKALISDKKNLRFRPLLVAIIVLVVTTFITSWVTLFSELASSGFNTHSINSYVVKPTITISTLGFIPAIIAGVLLSRKLMKNE